MGYCGLAVCFGSRPGCFDGIAYMKILVISGFLGAGKTTFIKELAKRTKQDFAVMENEYGAVGVDGGLLSGTQDDSGAPLNIWELTEGCICCTRKSDFATSVLTIANTIDPEYLVVEPTGVGMLSKIMENIRMIQYERIFLLSPITILDGEHFEQSLEKFPDICRDQIQTAGTILISKREQADEEERRQMEARIRAINPGSGMFCQCTLFEDGRCMVEEPVKETVGFRKGRGDGRGNLRSGKHGADGGVAEE